jgi:CheY-like chemotaxis protein
MSVPVPTILVVEDNPTDVMLIRRAFAKAKVGNPLQVVGHGDAAVDYLAGRGEYADRAQFPLPALILLDLKLPRRSGLEVLDWLRDQDVLRRIPAVVLTSSSQSRDVNRAYDLGANSYLVKPVEFDDLREMLSKINIYWIDLNVKPTVAPAGE